MRVLLAFLFTSLCISQSFGLTVEEYATLKNDSEVYIKGVGDGLHLASVFLEMNGRPPLFCLPDRSVLTAQDLVSIFKRELEESNRKRGIKQTKTLPVPLLLLLGLQSTFPCKPAQQVK